MAKKSKGIFGVIADAKKKKAAAEKKFDKLFGVKPEPKKSKQPENNTPVEKSRKFKLTKVNMEKLMNVKGYMELEEVDGRYALMDSDREEDEALAFLPSAANEIIEEYDPDVCDVTIDGYVTLMYYVD